MKIEQLQTSLMEGDMHGVFSVPSIMVGDATGNFDYVLGVKCSPIALFYLCKELNFDTIKRWCSFGISFENSLHFQPLGGAM